ncbi:hypothetical protein IJG04_00865 [Candidatus Saccharibacteria bacterium]|nr:hypothetical protein [Candidatus Saccharibacteria bacterium]
MVRQIIHKQRIKLYGLTTIALVFFASAFYFAGSASAIDNCATKVSNNNTVTNNCSENSVTFNVNVHEILSVSLTTPTNWASGDAGDLLRNKLNLSVTSNNATGFVAYMYADNARNTTSGCTPASGTTVTSLVNCSKNTSTIATLGSNVTVDTTNGDTAGAFTTNRWGYSVNDAAAGYASAVYKPLALASAPTVVLADSATSSDSNVTVSGSTYDRDIYFGAKADSSVNSGSYAGTVVFTVVSGVTTDSIDNPSTDKTDNNYTEPTNPSPATDNSTSTNVATYNSTANRTVYRGSTSYSGSGNSSVSGNMSTTTTEVSSGNTTSSYANAQGVTTTANIGEGTPLATGLAVTSAVAATSGIIFFIVAKRKKDDDEEEEEQM